MERDSLWAYPAALAAVRTSACHMEGPYNMEHLFFKGIHIGFLRAAKLITVKHTFTAAAGRTYIPAGITADTFA